ncbi:Hint domain-containing protein [Bradyrhizobium sp. USDA 3650]
MDKTSSATTISFSSTGGTLEINTNGTLSVTNALAIGNNTVKLDGASGTVQLTDGNGLTLSGGTISGTGTIASGTNLSGTGTVAISIANSGTITATGGTLDLTGAVTNRTLAISSSSASVLKIDGTVIAAALTIGSANQTLEVGTSGNLTLTSAQTLTNGKIQLDGGTLTDTSGITLTSPGQIIGSGTIATGTTVSGTGTVTANGGTLDIFGTINSGVKLAIGTTTASVLKIDGTATSSTAISLTDSDQTLSIGATGALTIVGALQQDVSGAHIVLGGGSLTASGGIHLHGSASVSGFGTLNVGTSNGLDTSQSGIITASGGVLNLVGKVDLTGASSGNVTIATGSASTLEFSGGSASIDAITINNVNQTLEVGASGSLSISGAQGITNGTILLAGGTLTDTSGLTVGAGAKLTGFGTVGTGTTVNGTGTITASGGVLEFKGAVDTTSSSIFHVASTGTLKFDGAVGTAAIKPTVAFDSATGVLDLSSMSGESSNFHGVVTGFKSGDQIKLTVAGAGTETYTTSFSGGQTTLIIKQGSTTVGTVVLQGDYRNAHFSIGESGTLDTITTDAACFMAGTMIQTPNGEVAVEELKRGDLVLTSDGQVRPVSWLGVQTVSTRFADKMRVWPIRVLAGALEQNVPSRDLLLSPDHALLVEGALVQAGALVNGTSILRETNVPEVFVYYHVELDDHSLILAENTPAETFVDNVDRLNFDNWAEHQELYPEGKPMTELSYPRAKAQRQVPVRTRITLAARAQAIGADATAVA